MFRSKEEQFDFYWKEIFDGLAYNPIEFNTYRFDQTMSLPGKVNKLYDMFKVLAMNSQEVMDYLKEFVETFDFKLETTIKDVLVVWLNEGLLADVVREAISEEVIEARTDYLGHTYLTLKERLDLEKTEFNNQLNQKANQKDMDILKREGINIYEYENLKQTLPDGSFDFTPVIQKTIDEAMKTGTKVIIPPGEYILGSTLRIGERLSQEPVSLVGIGSSGSFLGEKPVVLTRPKHTTHVLVKALGRGLNIENICFDGQGTIGNLMEVDRGFEFRIKDSRFFNAEGHGLLARSLANARIENTHFDICGGYENRAALRIKGHSDWGGTSNSVHIDNVHLERNPSTDLDLAFGNEPDDFAEFIFINGLHIEGAINHSDLTTYKQVPHVKIGNVRGVEITNSFIYGGKGPLIHYEWKKHSGFNRMAGVSISNTYLLGTLVGGEVTSDTPDRLIDLVAGDGFSMLGCQLDSALVEHVRVSETFGANVYMQNNYNNKRVNSTETFINDLRTGARLGLEYPDTAFYNNTWARKDNSAKIRMLTDGTFHVDTNNSAVDFVNATLLNLGGFKTRYGLNQPYSGNHSQGDKLYNSQPTTGNYLGWVCVESGNPGVWKPFGLIE